MGAVSVPLELLFSLVGFATQIAIVFATLAVWSGRIDQRIKAVETHSEAVQKIGPLEARFEQFERAIETRMQSLEGAVREAAAAVQQLALALAKRAA